MAWNTARAKYRSAELAALDCSPNTRQARTSGTKLWGSFTASASQALAAGACVAMVRVPAGAVILGADLYWAQNATDSVVAVGDPFACGRLLGPISTAFSRGLIRVSVVDDTCGIAYGTCGRLEKLGTEGDGCGIGYTYTCATDLFPPHLPPTSPPPP